MKLRHCLCSIILLLTTICLLLSLPAFAADTAVGLSNFRPDLTYKDGMFADVSKNDWFYRNVAQAYEYGLMQGTGSGFVPTGNISIVETVVTACRLHNIYNGGGHVFEATTPWEKPYINYAIENGLIRAGDYPDYTAKATRAQFAEILANALPKEALPVINTVDNDAIPDVPASASYAEDAYLLYRAGIIIGDETNAFRADRQISRAEVAAILTRMANPALRQSVTLRYDALTYTVNADGKSYTVTGCDSSVTTVRIPTEHNGLPVTAIDGAAFVGCDSLREFTVDADHPVFYTEDGVLFTDLPEKTLVRMPPAYCNTPSYIVPAGTVHIAPYAFAGITSIDTRHELISITLQEGVRSLGDCAFASYQDFQMFIYVPDSLTEIGRDLTQFSKGNIPFYVSSWDTAMAIYANQNNIPCGVLHTNQPTDIELPASAVPECLPAQQMTKAAGDTVTVRVEELGYYGYQNLSLNYFHDFSEQQRDFDGEIRLLLEERWKDAIPDAKGNVKTPYFTQTGIWGAGKTDGEAILRGYDLDGKLVCMQYVSGDFTFAFPGAYQLGVEGGTDTKLTVLPVEPIYLENTCDYPVYPDQWHELPDGNIMQWFVVCDPFVSFTHQNSDDRIWLGYMHLDAASNIQSYEMSPNYHIVQFFTLNNAYVDALKYSVIRFDTMETVYQSADFAFMKNSQVTLPTGYAESAYGIWKTVKNVMDGTYISSISDTYQIYLLANDQYPACSRNIITIDRYVYDSFEAGRSTLIHEMIHAADGSIQTLSEHSVAPSPWYEGRAEYIGEKIMDACGYDYYGYEETCDWSFLSEEEKQDFFHYYYYSTNRTTEYIVGYYFMKYLCETYGEDITAKINDNLAAVTDYDSAQWTDRNALIFKSCITSVTDENVFQNFVRDVIEG